ncbi:hypothetical protein G9A89_019145 [Geosiphon pyriformis]|nr:hypothetical protein G9A89_019145 [Geosiphon pyriformis]
MKLKLSLTILVPVAIFISLPTSIAWEPPVAVKELWTVCMCYMQGPRYNTLVTFGDSSSGKWDIFRLKIGNVYALTKKKYPPSNLYFKGRFSNGPVWSEYLTKVYNMRLMNFAFGGITGDGITKIPGLVQQVDTYLASQKDKKNINKTIVSTFLAGNDYEQTALKAKPEEVVERIAGTWPKLYEHGIRAFIIVGFFDLSRLPIAKTYRRRVVQLAHFRSTTHTEKVFEAATRFEQSHPDAIVYRFPYHEFLDIYQRTKAVTDGVDNFEDECLDLNPQPPTICQNPETHYFWDKLHLTTKIHSAMAQMIAQILGFEESKIKKFEVKPVRLPIKIFN